MRLLINILFTTFLFSLTALKSQAQSDSITAINYILRLPLVLGDKQYFDFGDTTTIYYYQDLIVYQLPYTFDSSKTIYHVKADTISDEHILTEKRYNYFIYRQGSPKGIWYRSIDYPDSNRLLPVDSILKIKSPPPNLQSLIYSSNDTLIETVSLNDIFIEKYIPKIKPDESYNDTTVFYYSKSMSSIKYSLSPFLDSLKNAKLYRLRLAFNETYSQKYSITMPQRDLVYEIVKLEFTNVNKMKLLIQRFKQDEMQ